MPRSVHTCDVAVVGAGAAGLSAAIAAARTGARVVVADTYSRPGGQYYRQSPRPDRPPSDLQREGMALAAAAEEVGAELLTGTSVWSAGQDLELLRADGVATLRATAL